MHPWLWDHPPVSTYGVCLVAGVIAGWAFARRLARSRRLDPSHIDLLIPLLLAAGLLGAWAFGRWTDVATGVQAHGAVLIGAMAAATAAGAAYGVWQRMPLGVLGDVLAAPAALVIAAGRVGCFFAGCCYGKVCAGGGAGVQFPGGSLASADHAARGWIGAAGEVSLSVYPVQLWEAAACAALAGVLACGGKWPTAPRRYVSGERFLALGVGYAFIRGVTEGFRGDNPAVWGPLTFSQIGAVAMLLAALATGGVRRRWAGRWGLRPATAGGGE
jgi:phosphatidylglycerol:prolipoprotein diacylglycerol transferase